MGNKVAVFTGSRAEYGLLYWLLKSLDADSTCEQQLIVSAMHLSPEFGLTVQQIEKDGFEISDKIEMLISSDTSVGVTKSIGVGIISFGEALDRSKPDLLIILGDRFEALAMATAATIMGVPIMHLHGGEITEGAYDDSIRHAITKFSHIHGVSSESSRRRVIQLGEDPMRVFTIGALGIEHIHKGKLTSLSKVEKYIDFNLGKKYFLLAYHPATYSNEKAESTVNNILSIVNEFPEFKLIITLANADDGGRSINAIMRKFEEKYPTRIKVISSLGSQMYLTLLKFASCIIGNSSSGIIEAPSLKTLTINVGDRQKGRDAASSVLHCGTKKTEIYSAIRETLLRKENNDLPDFINPYDQGISSDKILKIIKETNFNRFKKFCDIDWRPKE
ncbi:UDP-N-acetylglucosamine 2-epimerase [Gammaproteobacteria bacterium]|nr:UDP-N-acetylglucosamine 2-epimerase [Gammaproteobacteria bacterium]MDC1021663.1 UDP-N-acetylglucosamine 2-epimerase [Gammaproteobacteria bacterium]